MQWRYIRSQTHSRIYTVCAHRRDLKPADLKFCSLNYQHGHGYIGSDIWRIHLKRNVFVFRATILNLNMSTSMGMFISRGSTSTYRCTLVGIVLRCAVPNDMQVEALVGKRKHFFSYLKKTHAEGGFWLNCVQLTRQVKKTDFLAPIFPV